MEDNLLIGTAAKRLERKRAGQLLVAAASAVLVATLIGQILYKAGATSSGFETWRPVLYAYILWAIAMGVNQVVARGDAGQRALFILPAVLFTVAVVIFPTIFGVLVAVTDWNLSGVTGPRFNGLANFYQMLGDAYFWNALANMVFYVATVFVQYAIAFGLALLLNLEIRGRKFFRVAFLLPFMLSPVAVSWMIGKSIMDFRSGPLTAVMRALGWENPSFFTSPMIARLSVAMLDAWVWIPFTVILLLAGLQAISKEVQEAAKVDGAGPWESFWHITFPLMLPVSITALIVRVIFQLKLADIVINTTYGGPGGATDTVSSFIFREYRDRSNVGYGTMLAMVYLVIIVVFLSIVLSLLRRFSHWKEGSK
ncbi:carbohydrate ABC transporter permease [Rhizobium sp. Root708]|uniref:carbohydrate ABC transporter permease n=1 Tax=Rhizobium sp. Root708 TaxID=1736592 RepID=UPI001FCD1501|nr:sugar ABC transporter permease [Rhizobium sp. Root708]